MSCIVIAAYPLVQHQTKAASIKRIGYIAIWSFRATCDIKHRYFPYLTKEIDDKISDFKQEFNS